jgi:hypothetical protein
MESSTVAHDQVGLDAAAPVVTVGEGFLEIVPGVDVHQREGDLAGVKGLDGEVTHDDRVLAAGE